MRALGWVLAVLALLLALLAAAVIGLDAPARAAAERRVAAALQTQVPFTDEPQVTIEGRPFLLGAVTGLPSVHVRASGMPVAGEGIQATLADPDFTLTGVRTDLRSVTADALTGSAGLTFDELKRVTGWQLRLLGDGRLGYEAGASVGGVSLTASVSGRPLLDEGSQTVTIAEPKVTVVGFDLPQALVDAVAGQVLRPLPIALPLGLRLTSVGVGPDRLTFGVAGGQLTFPLQ